MSDTIYVCNLEGDGEFAEASCVWDDTNDYDPATDCVMSCAGVTKAECEHWVVSHKQEND